MERPVRLDRKCRVIDIVKQRFDKLQRRLNMGTEQSRQYMLTVRRVAVECH